MKTGYKISDNIVVNTCSKNCSTTVMLQSLCYNEHKKIDEYNDLEFKHVNQSIYGQLWPYSNKYLINCDNVKYYTNQRLVFIFRDPIKRFLSAYKTWFVGRNKTIDEFVNFVKEDIETNKHNLDIINVHYRPQYTFINFDDIDIFIEQNDYEMFCDEIGIQYLKANQNKDLSYQSKIELTDEHISILKDLYKKDYEMIEKIKNSGKLYNGHYKDIESTIKHSIYSICGKSGDNKLIMNKKYLCLSQLNFLTDFKNYWNKVSDKYAVVSISKNGCSTVCTQSYTYQNKIDINNFKNAEYKHLNDANFSYIFEDQRKYIIKEKDNSLVYVCIIRDPIERLLSAYKTKPFFIENSFDEFLLNVKYTFNNCLSHEIDQHIHLQSAHFDFNDVDIFVYLSDYEKFCNEHNISFIKLNQNPDKKYQTKIELTDEHISIIKDIYKEDYEMIEKIKNSGKLYNGAL